MTPLKFRRSGFRISLAHAHSEERNVNKVCYAPAEAADLRITNCDEVIQKFFSVAMLDYGTGRKSRKAKYFQPNWKGVYRWNGIWPIPRGGGVLGIGSTKYGADHRAGPPFTMGVAVELRRRKSGERSSMSHDKSNNINARG